MVALLAGRKRGAGPQQPQAQSHSHPQGLRHFLFQAASHLLRCGMLARVRQLPSSPRRPLTLRWPGR